MTIKTTIHTYRFDVSTSEGRAGYAALCEKMKALGVDVFCTWGGGLGHFTPFTKIDGREIELDVNHLFSNQWNTAPISGFSEKGYRVFDWAEDYPINFPKNIKRGHYLEQTDEMANIRAETAACGYCGKQEPVLKGLKFCPHCIGSEYLKEGELHLLRMIPTSAHNTKRAELTTEEKAELLPLYVVAQTSATTARNKAKMEKARIDIEKTYKAAIEKAKTEYDGFSWLLENGFPTDNVIFYSHTRRFSFGWRQPVGAAVLSRLLDIIAEFPFPYEIKTEDGRTLSGNIG